MLGLLGTKLGMTQRFNGDGDFMPVTVVKIGPCTVVQKKTKESDGYNALQLGYDAAKPSRLSKAERGHCEKKKLATFRTLKEFRTENVGEFNVGDEITVGVFKTGDFVNVSGVTKGKGFQGVMKRHGKHGGPASHGSDFHRRPGSIGMRTWPGRVLKNMKLPGHMGSVNVTTQNLEVVEVRPEDGVLLIKGAVPGANNGLLVVIPTSNDFEKRPELKKAKPEAKAEAKVEQKNEAAAPAENETKETKEGVAS